jgi:hypothetical protein
MEDFVAYFQLKLEQLPSNPVLVADVERRSAQINQAKKALYWQTAGLLIKVYTQHWWSSKESYFWTWLWDTCRGSQWAHWLSAGPISYRQRGHLMEGGSIKGDYAHQTRRNGT